ncbi:hypothetical protein B0H17DRAFT_1211604 [Mycena rosella]|uniref:Uncharacterized protein n=1 Tax=Mycena rosella TaxID=1033263 RepID=A0AAD7CUE2_MYCRO|nr:hypothetical protein B0H17DRAFT_1211604 [Mycena rosella]
MTPASASRLAGELPPTTHPPPATLVQQQHRGRTPWRACGAAAFIRADSHISSNDGVRVRGLQGCEHALNADGQLNPLRGVEIPTEAVVWERAARREVQSPTTIRTLFPLLMRSS